jgi:hypothetical protein
VDLHTMILLESFIFFLLPLSLSCFPWHNMVFFFFSWKIFEDVLARKYLFKWLVIENHNSRIFWLACEYFYKGVFRLNFFFKSISINQDCKTKTKFL